MPSCSAKDTRTTSGTHTQQEHHLAIPIVGAKRPTMMKHDRRGVSSLSRLARTAPADPPPTMMTSNSWSFFEARSDLAHQRGEGHVQRAIDLPGLRNGIVAHDLHHQGGVVADLDTEGSQPS